MGLCDHHHLLILEEAHKLPISINNYTIHLIIYFSFLIAPTSSLSLPFLWLCLCALLTMPLSSQVLLWLCFITAIFVFLHERESATTDLSLTALCRRNLICLTALRPDHSSDLVTVLVWLS